MTSYDNNLDFTAKAEAGIMPRPVAFAEAVPQVRPNVVLALLDAESDLFYSGQNTTPGAILRRGYHRSLCSRAELLAAAARLNAWRGGVVVEDPLCQRVTNSSILGRERMECSFEKRARTVQIVATASVRVTDGECLSPYGVLMLAGMDEADMVHMRRMVAITTSDA